MFDPENKNNFKMKTLKTILSVVLITSLSSCTKEHTNKQVEHVPEKAQSNFSKENPDAKDVKWEQEGDYYQAEYEVNGKEKEISYDKDGNVVAVETEIDAKDLPENVHSYMKENYNDAEMEEACELKHDNETYYMVEVETGNGETELTFDAKGNFVKKEVEPDDESGENEDNENDEVDD